MSAVRRRTLLPAALVAAALALAACGGSSSYSSSTTTSSSSSTTAAPSTTTTTLTPAVEGALRALLLSPSDFAAGWTADSSIGADTAAGAPACIVDIDGMKGSTARVGTLYRGPGDTVQAIENAASYPAGQAVPSVTALNAVFQACNNTTVTTGGSTVHLTVNPLDLPTYGDASFTGQIVTTAPTEEGNEVIYLNTAYVVKGNNGISLFWESTSSDTTEFRTVLERAVAKL